MLATVLFAGCGTTVAGDAQRPDRSGATGANPGALNTGSYPATPHAPLGLAGSDAAGRLTEGHRMAGYVVGPWQVDPALVRPGTTGAAVVQGRDQMPLVLWPAMLTRVGTDPLIVGFVSERTTTDPKNPTWLRNAVLRYSDPALARRIAAGLTEGSLHMPVRADSTVPVPTEPLRPIAIPGHPETTATLFVHLDGAQTVREVIAATAHGPYVLVQVAQSAQEPERAAEMIARTIDLQAPLIDRFEPTDPAHFADLPLDPSGLVARTLPAKQQQATSMSNYAYDVPGALQVQDNPVQAGPALTDAAVDLVSVGRTTVYQARDPQAAQRLQQAFADDVAAGAATQAGQPVPGLPDSRCVRVAGQNGLLPRNWCAATRDRYMFATTARELQNAQQQIAAQYRMLGG